MGSRFETAQRLFGLFYFHCALYTRTSTASRAQAYELTLH